MNTERKPTYDELVLENQQFREENAQLKIKAARVDELEQEVVDLKRQVAELQAKVDQLTKLLYGKKSEKSKKKDRNDDVSAEQASSDDVAGDVASKAPRRKNGGGGRKPFPPEMPRRDVHIDLPTGECCCDSCGEAFVFMGVEITEVLNYIPMVCEVIRYIRHRYKRNCHCCKNKIVIAEMPIRVIDKGTVTTEFIAAVLINKYCDHLPVYRQVNRMFKNMHLDVAESSVCRWRDVVGKMLEPLMDVAKAEILRSRCINTDATTAPFRIPKEKHRCVNGNLFVYIGDAGHPLNIFDFQENQSAKGIHEFLDGYHGKIQCDAHKNYDAVFAPKNPDPQRPPPQEVGCHAHCRRNFVDAGSDEPLHVEEVLKLYRKLYKIEKEIRDASIAERERRRQGHALPLLDTLFQRCRDCLTNPKILPKSPLGKACAYALNNEIALRRYCEDGRLEIDNNISERTIKEFVLGRKNYLFFGSPDAARYSANIMSILSSAKRHGLDEWRYLTDVLNRLADLNSLAELREMLPDQWKKLHANPPDQRAEIRT
jgi:transposase